VTKRPLIPCFTWTIQLLVSAVFLDGKSRLRYWNRLGWVCLIGSIALLAAAFYNFRTVPPWVWLSIINVLASVVLMAITLHVLLRREGFRWQWTLVVLIRHQHVALSIVSTDLLACEAGVSIKPRAQALGSDRNKQATSP
jgi:hypothetical protein